MTGEALSRLIDELGDKARAASVAEQRFQKEVAQRAAEFKQERAFAYRRLNLLKAVSAAVARAESEGEALAAGRRAFFDEVGWNGATQNQKDVAARFESVAVAIRTVASREGGDAAEVTAALADFEAWYAETRKAPLLALMERETVELPLVEV